MKPSNYLITNIENIKQLNKLLEKYNTEDKENFIYGYNKEGKDIALFVKNGFIDGYAPLLWFITQVDYGKLPQITAFEELKLTIKTTAQYR
jgi:hypothetical protein